MSRTDARRFVLLAMLMIAGCSTPEGVSLEMPDDWQTNNVDRWWVAGVDTALAFRALDSLEDMGVVAGDMIYDSGLPAGSQRDITDARLAYLVQQELAPLYRNHPEIVDSLFQQYVRPKIRATDNPDAAVERLKREGYRSLSRHFRDPRLVTRLGEDVPIVVPDSLTALAAGRAVSMQIWLNEEGVPQAILFRGRLHPVLDRIALRATTQLRWQPAYVLRGSSSVPVGSWTRFRIRYPR